MDLVRRVGCCSATALTASASRRGVAKVRTVTELEARRCEFLADQRLHVGHGLGQKAGRDLLGTYFKKQFFGHENLEFRELRIQKSEFRSQNDVKCKPWPLETF